MTPRNPTAVIDDLIHITTLPSFNPDGPLARTILTAINTLETLQTAIRYIADAAHLNLDDYDNNTAHTLLTEDIADLAATGHRHSGDNQ